MEDSRSIKRVVTSIACIALAFGLTISAIHAGLAAADLGKPVMRLNVARHATKELPRIALARSDARGPSRQIAILGDSTVVSYRPGRRVPERLEQELVRLSPGDESISVLNLAVQGISPFDYFFLADEIIRARPDAVVLSLNLDALSETWRRSYARPELAGMLSPRRISRAVALPLHTIGLSFDELLFYISVVQLGAFEHWHALATDQALMGRGLAQARDAFDALLGRQASQDLDDAILADLISDLFEGRPGSPYWRYSAHGVLDHYEVAMRGVERDHPIVLALAGTLEAFEQADIPVFVFVTPLNVEHFAAREVLDTDGLADTIGQLEEISRAHAAGFADLHDLLPDAAYRDAPGHYLVSDEIDGPQRIAEAIAPALIAHLEDRARTSR